MSNLPVLYRAPNAGDTSFFFNSYLKSFREAGINKAINTNEYYTLQGEWANRFFAAPYSRLLLVVNPEDPEQIYGYMWYLDLGGHLFVNWLYIKAPFRKFGLAKGLLSTVLDNYDGQIFHTHLNGNAPLLKKYAKNSKFVPYYFLETPK